MNLAPYARYTHWKQTVFYSKEEIRIKQNEKLSGHVSCKRNKKNPRNIEVQLNYSFEGEYMKSKDLLNYIIRQQCIIMTVLLKYSWLDYLLNHIRYLWFL